MILTNPFNGRMNLDDADFRVISNGDYVDALNITRDSPGEGQDSVVSGVIGNVLMPYSLPDGTNKVIGFKEDKKRNRAYYFIWNSNNYHSIVFFDNNKGYVAKLLESKTDSAGVDILEFNPSYKVLSINIVYRDTEGDLLFFNDGNTQPKCINVSQSYTIWRKQDILVIKAPPVMPPQVVYENDTTTTQNNLRNSLFQFSYRYVYDTKDKSVWSARSIVPLPQQDALNYTSNDYKENSRISVNFSTGGQNVRGIELAFRQTTNGITSDWKLIKLFDKAFLNISDDSVYTFLFKNDSVYTPLDILETELLQDYVPLKANASELANGNVLLYAGITEGYNKTNTNLVAYSLTDNDNFFFDKCGLLFFATINGQTSGTFSSSSNTFLTIYLYGTGTNNSSNAVSTLNNAAGTYAINLQTVSQDISVSYTNTSVSATTSSILTALSTALQTKSFSQVSLTNNVLTMRVSGSFASFYQTNVVLLNSSGVKYLSASGEPQNAVFANSWESGYTYAIQYFDSEGRTIGAQTNAAATIITQNNSTIFKYCQPYVKIAHQPPLEAAYYHLLRSNNTTYSKRLFWISNSAYQSSDVNGRKYAYIGIDNISVYNEQFSSTEKVVSYEFTPGDRIKFLKRYDASGNEQFLNQSLGTIDYEILGTETTIKPMIDNYSVSVTRTGLFIKINYPSSDINSSTFNFSGSDDFQNYQIFIYNYTQNTETKTFFEFAKCFAIGNPGTSSRYHFGLEQQQSPANLSGVPAIISAINGDLFYRKRNVVISKKYELNFIQTTDYTIGYKEWSFFIKPPAIPVINNSLYQISTQPANIVSSTGSSYPVYSSTGYLFFNKSLTKTLKINIKGTFVINGDQYYTSVTLAAIICSNAGIPTSPKYSVPLYEPINISSAPIQVDVDVNIDIPPNSKMWIIAQRPIGILSQIITNASIVSFSVLSNQTIDIIENSFSDNNNIVTNSNGRASAVEENAAQTYYPTLIRFGQEYQLNTQINNINRFYPQDFDEYDNSFGDVMRLHIRDRILIVYQKFKVGKVPVLTQIIKDVTGNPLQANSDKLINKIQYYAGDFGIGDADTSLAWNNYSDYFVDNYRGVVCRLSQDGITPISMIYKTNSFFTTKLMAYRKSLNNGVTLSGVYKGDPCIYGVFDAITNKYIIAMEEIARYSGCGFAGGIAYLSPTVPTTTTTTTTTTTSTTTTSTTTTNSQCFIYQNNSAINWVGDYQDCDGTWYYGATLATSGTICARVNSPFTLTGTDLTATGNCTFSVYVKAKGTVTSFPNLIIQVGVNTGTGYITTEYFLGNPLSYDLAVSGIPYGAQVRVGVVQFGTSNNLQFGIGFNGSYTGYCGYVTRYVTTVTGFDDIYMNVNTSGTSYVTC